MTVLTPLQVAAAAYAGGFRGNEIEQAVATAFAESSWNTTSKNACCYGLWQINKSAHSQLFASGDWTNPIDNARMAHSIFTSAGGWCTSGSPPNCNPWQGYGNSMYATALSRARVASTQLSQQLSSGKTAESIVGSAGTGSNTGTTTQPAGFTDTLGAAVNPHNWLRMTTVLIGSFFTMIALWRMTKDTSAYTKVKSGVTTAVTTVVPEAKAVKAVSAVKSVAKGK